MLHQFQGMSLTTLYSRCPDSFFFRFNMAERELTCNLCMTGTVQVIETGQVQSTPADQLSLEQ